MVKYIKWVGSLCLILAGALIAFKISFDIIYLSYFLFATGHILWIGVFVKQKEWSLVMANVFFLFIDIVGIVKWIQ